MRGQTTFRNGRIFDGTGILEGYAARFEDGVLAAIAEDSEVPASGVEIDLEGDILCPGYTDLQVNGGGGVLLNDDPSVATLNTIADAHRRLGTTTLLPTLITDTPEKTQAAIEAAKDAIKLEVPGIAGLHLEGPHLSLARAGAHDPALIREMEDADLELLLAAAAGLPVLKVTLAPESATEAQVAALAGAGALVSLGHSDADAGTCRRYFAAGARAATHLYNAMPKRMDEGLAGAALEDGGVSAGLIADGIHVDADVMRAVWSAMGEPGRVFLVSDAMAVAGTDLGEFRLGGRRILRRDGRLTLDDGTLAGADLDLTAAVRNSVEMALVPLGRALGAATSVPSALIGNPVAGPGPGEWRLADAIRIAGDLSGAEPLG